MYYSKILKKHPFLLPFVIGFFGLSSTPALAHGWVYQGPFRCQANAYAFVPPELGTIADSGRRFRPCSADTGTLMNGTAKARAVAETSGNRGSRLWLTAQNGGRAGSDNFFVYPIVYPINSLTPDYAPPISTGPFVSPVSPVPDVPGFVEIEFDVSRNNNSLYIFGNQKHSENGFLELSVLNLTGLTLEEQEGLSSNIFLNFGSVEKALVSGAISSSQVLFRARETEFADGLFGFQLDVGSLADNDIIVTTVAHAISASVPEPSSTLGLLALGTLGAASTLKRKLKSSQSTEKETTKVS